MKKIISIMLSFIMILMLSACGNSETVYPQDSVAEDITAETGESTEGVTERAGELETGEGNILIAYFSFPMDGGVDAVSSASRARYDDGSLGNTNYVANLIREETGGELFFVETEENHYPADDFEALAELARIEIENDEKPAIRTQIENLDDYDVIFVGYPIWWYDMPAVMYTFFEAYDFSGKTIIPFTTHGGSRLSGTVEIIQELEPDAMVITDAFTVSRDAVTDAREDVAEWVDSLNLGQRGKEQ